MFAAGVISVRGGCNKCSRDNTWNKQPATDQSDYSISSKYGITMDILVYYPSLQPVHVVHTTTCVS